MFIYGKKVATESEAIKMNLVEASRIVVDVNVGKRRSSADWQVAISKPSLTDAIGRSHADT